MKTKSIRITTLALMAVALCTVISCSTTSEPPPADGASRITYTKGVPGGVIVQSYKITATVTAIDHDKRKATLLAPDGEKFTVKVGPEAINFDQIHVGDRINATVTERIIASLDKGGATSAEGTAAVTARAPKGGEPGGLAAETTQRTGKIIAIDTSNRTVTIRFQDGNTQTAPIRKDVELSRLKVGAQLVFRVTDLVAIWVEKP